jgi:hypothetical protein
MKYYVNIVFIYSIMLIIILFYSLLDNFNKIAHCPRFYTFSHSKRPLWGQL